MICQAKLLVGIDEAGRGPLAGPVVAAAVILHPERPILGLADSKKLTEKKRLSLDQEIREKALFVSVSTVDPHIIDEINILQATFVAMGDVLEQAVARYPESEALIDGNQTLKKLKNIPQKAIVRGDSTIEAIMAASILAKVHRDRLMHQFDAIYPNYGFAQHKGYGTERHRQAIAAFGPCPIHRRSFAPFTGEHS